MAIKILSVDDEQDLEALLTQYFRRKIRKGEYEFSFAHNGLGVVPGLTYKEQSLKLEVGDSLFLYTDGISEAMNLRNEQYGDIRLVQACGSVRDRSPRSMIEGISESVHSFVNGATQSDDITMLALTYKK